MLFRSFRKQNSTQKNTNTVYSEYSYSERSLYINVESFLYVTELSGEKRSSDDDGPVGNSAKRQKLAGTRSFKSIFVAVYSVQMYILRCQV